MKFEDGKGCNIGVEHLGIAEVTNPRVVYYSIYEDLDTALSSLVSLAVLNQGDPGGFSTNVVKARSFRIDCLDIAHWAGVWTYKGSAVVVKIPIHAGNESPEVVNTVDAVVGGLEKDKQDGIGETSEVALCPLLP